MNKKMKIKALALMLIGAMSMGSLVGCSGGTDSVQTPADKDKTEATGDKTSEKPVELVWWTVGTEPTDLAMVNDAINEYTKEKLNVTLDIKYAGWGDYGDKLSKIVQSGESYDLAFGAGINGYQDLANKGYFADLTDLLPTVTPALYEFIPEALWQGITINEQIVGVPAYKDSAQAQYWVWDQATVEELGIDYTNIRTLPELEVALKAMKAAKPGEYPLTIAGTEGINGFIATQCGYDELVVKPSIGVSYADETAKVVGVWEQENTLENLRIIHSWFKEGLINQDAATLTEAPKHSKVYAAQGYPHADADWSKTEGYPVVSNMYFGPAYSTRTIQGSFMAISAGSKHIEESLKVIELINTDPYMRNLLAFGIEDVHYKKTGDTSIEVIGDKYAAPAYSQGTFFNMYTVDPAPASKWEDLRIQTESAFSSPALGFTFDTQNVQNQIAACVNIEDKYRPSLLTGSVDPDEVLPKMIAELNKAGYQDIIAEVQTQLDEYLGK